MSIHTKRFIAIALIAIAVPLSIGSIAHSQASIDDIDAKLQVPLQLLYETSAEDRASAIGGFEQALTAESFGLVGSESRTLPAFNIRDHSVQVVIHASNENSTRSIEAVIGALEGSIEITSNNMIQAFVPIDMLGELAQLSQVNFVRLPIRVSYGISDEKETSIARSTFAQETDDFFLSEGVEVIGADSWKEFGLSGKDVRVGIMDQFGGYRALIGTELPDEENVTIQSFAQHGEIFNPNRREEFQDHGTNVAEIVFDIAPGASQHIAYFETAVEFSSAIQWMIDEDVDVINTSIGFHSGCFQGDGIFEPQFRAAKESGITWATASGNEADQYIRFDWQDTDDDELHNFTDTDNNNSMAVLIREASDDDDNPIGMASITAIYSWDAPCRGASNDYELVVSVEEDDELVELVEFEEVFNSWGWEPGRPIKVLTAFHNFDESLIGETAIFHVGVRKRLPEVADATISIDTICICGIQHVDANGSVGVIEPSVSKSVITIGAAHHAIACNNFPSSVLTCPDGRLLFYSSQGPTPDGRLKPNIAAPTHVSTASSGTFSGNNRGDNFGFGGTSGATPHVAGAMALVVQALRLLNENNPTPDEVFEYLAARAEDLGDPGEDNQYGVGLLHLGQPPDVEIPVEPELSATAFASVQFINSADWERAISQSCIIYTNISDSPSPVRVTLTNGDTREILVAQNDQAWICDNVIHIDTSSD